MQFIKKLANEVETTSIHKCCDCNTLITVTPALTPDDNLVCPTDLCQDDKQPNVLSFKNAKCRKEYTPLPEQRGDSVCLGCGGYFYAVAPYGTYQLDCPHCYCAKAIFLLPTHCRDKQSWFCGCGGFLFYLTKYGSQCYICGEYQNFNEAN